MGLVFQGMLMVVNLATNHCSHDGVEIVVVVVEFGEDFVGGRNVDHFEYKLEGIEKGNLGVSLVPLKWKKQRVMVMKTLWKHCL